MGKFANDLMASMKQAVAHAKGRKVRGMRVTARAASTKKGRRKEPKT